MFNALEITFAASIPLEPQRSGRGNEYLEQGSAPDGKTLVFETEQIENIPSGWRARETYKILAEDEFIEVFELAEPGKDFKVYSERRWKRVR